jgi:predicted RND superfamily exporter protein
MNRTTLTVFAIFFAIVATAAGLVSLMEFHDHHYIRACIGIGLWFLSCAVVTTTILIRDERFPRKY